MKQSNKVKRLNRRIKAYEETDNKKGFTKPGSFKK